MFNRMPMYTGSDQYNMMPSYGNTAPTQNQMQNSMPYGYGMTNENPLPMQPSPVSSLPPLFPSMLTPQLNPQAPFTTQNLSQARYAEGGSVVPHNLSELAEYIREEGDDDDTILAHINPEEADELAYNYGMDINPHTGLPQFGKIKRIIKKVVHPVKKVIPKELQHIVKKALPVIGAVVGNALVPGIGAPVGGALAGALSTKRPMKGALRGLGVGAGLGYALPAAGRALSAIGAPNVGAGLQAIGAGQYGAGLGALKQAILPGAAAAGIPGAAPVAAGLAGKSLYPEALEAVEPAKDKGILGGILGAGGLQNLLLPGAIAGLAMRREKMKPAYPQPAFENVQAMAGPAAIHKMWRPEQMAREIAPYEREALEPEDISEAMAGRVPYSYSPYFREYATGGQVGAGGYMQGGTKGQDDKIPAMLSDGEFVIPADVVSAQGDGNNAAGAQQFYEYISMIRKHKGQKQGLPPKAKSLSVYMSKRSKR